MRPRNAVTGIVAAALLLAVAAPAAGAAPGKLVFQGCQSSPQGPPEPGCSQLEGLSYTGAFALSLDGQNAYASRPRGVSVFDRDPASGALAYVECFDSTGDPPCTQVPGMHRTPVDIAVPHDGTSVYLAGGRSGPLISFLRDPQDGRLTFAACASSSYGADGDPPGCPTGSFQEANQVESSRDGRSVYLADNGCADNTGECFASIVVYVRDPQTSLLTETGRGSPATQGDGPFAVTPGTGTVYQLDSNWGTISVFKRIGDSRLKRTQCLWPRKQRFQGPCRKIRKMGRAAAIAVSPHGKSVVTVVNPKRGKSWLTLFHRARNGKLSFQRRAFDRRLRSIDDLRFSSNGTLLAASGAGTDSFLLRFKINHRRGEAAVAQCLASAKRKGCTRIAQLRGLSEIAGFNRQLYAVARNPDVVHGLNAILRFGLVK